MMRAGPLARWKVSPLQFLTLLQLIEGPKYGYEMMKIIRDEFEGVWELKTGTFYPALRRMEARGFVETNLRNDTEFYSLTGKGTSLLENMGERFQLEYKFAAKYFNTILKWIPTALKYKVLGIFQTLSKENLDVFSNLPLFFDDTMEKEHKLEIVRDVRNILNKHLNVVEKLYQEISDGGEP